MKSYSLLLAICLTFAACKDKVDNTLINASCPITTLLDNDLFSNGPNDGLLIKSAEITDNCINLTIEYSGGCVDLDFTLVASEEVMESFPVQRNIRISFTDNDDCEALITNELTFDLTPARANGEEEVILRLTGWDEGLSYKY